MTTMMKQLLGSDLFHNDRLRRFIPGAVKRALKKRVPYADYRVEQLRREAETRFGGPIPLVSDYESRHPVRLGIFFDNSYTFVFNVAACRELEVSYRVIDLMASNWVRRVVESGCDAFLATPPILLAEWRRLFDERLWVVSHDLEKRVCPRFDELYLWESKRRMHNWLVAHSVPHPRTWVFADRDEAMGFCRETAYPVVSKTDGGAASSGVFILSDQRAAERLVGQAFSRGIVGRSADARQKERGSILFQEHVPHDYEWRVVRIGDDFMCRRKVRAEDFASGSGDIGWAGPLPGMLDFAKQVTDAGGFTSMSVDMFENTTGRGDAPFLVNELQPIIGAIECEDNLNRHAGRWVHDSISGEWSFDSGYFYHNACANLRVRMMLKRICEQDGGGVRPDHERPA